MKASINIKTSFVKQDYKQMSNLMNDSTNHNSYTIKYYIIKSS